jgi:acyl transferase domain-containing protein
MLLADWSQILGSGVSTCGGLAPVNAPVAEMQANAADRAWAETGRKFNEVDFVEVHGTGKDT